MDAWRGCRRGRSTNSGSAVAWRRRQAQTFDIPKEAPEDLPFVKPEDYQYFAKLLDDKKEEELTAEEVRRRARRTTPLG